MDVAVLCDICGRPVPKPLSCMRCGRRVCEAHMTQSGLCVHCAGGTRA